MNHDSVIDNDGNSYGTIIIGDQIWMAENLRVTSYQNGDLIHAISDRHEWKSTRSGAYSRGKGVSQSVLYNWYAVNDSRHIAPVGWHVPSSIEWDEMVKTLGGFKTAGGKLKANGTNEWSAPNSGADNSSGFNAMPFGFRSIEENSHMWLGRFAFFWTGDSATFGGAHHRSFSFNSVKVQKNRNNKNYGLAVRCVKDR